jgi:hypothetical protein
MLALATALVFSSCNQTTTSPSPSAADPTPTTLTITITVEEMFGAFDIEKCGRRQVGRVALAEYAGVPNSQLLEWITDNRDEYETWCIAHYYELFEPTESSDLEEAIEERFAGADTLVRASLTDAQLVWCFNDATFELVADAAATLGIEPATLADEIRVELIGIDPPRVLSAEEVRTLLLSEAWEAWYALRPDYFIRSCQAAFEAFGGRG